MAQTEIPQKEKKDILEQTPVKLTVDAQYSGNSAGQVFNAQATAQMSAIPVSISGGGGFLNLNYLNNPLGFGSGTLRFSTNVGSESSLFGQTTFAYIPSTYNQTSRQYYEAGNLGATWNLIPSTSDVMLRVGLEGTVKYFENPGGLTQQYESLSAGASFGYRRLTIYAMGRAVFTSPSPIEEFWTQDIRPWPDQIKGGAIVRMNKGDELGVEINATVFEQGGKVSYRLGSFPAPTQIYATFRHTSKIFGGNEVGAGVSIEFEKKRGAKIMGSVQQEFGGKSLGQSQTFTAERVNFQALTSYLYSKGLISADQMVQRLNPSLNVTGTHTENLTGTPQTLVTYTQNGTNQLFTPMTKQTAIEFARKTFDASTLAFLENLFSSNGLQDFAKRYGNSSTDEKVLTASRLAMIANNGYSKVLEDLSPFSPEKKDLASLTPNTEFLSLQQSMLTHKQRDEGICGNINGMAAEFLRLVGVEAYALVVGGPTGPHVIAGARDEKTNASYVVNYDQVYKTPGSGMWPAVQAYSKANGLVLIGAFVYGRGNEYIGYYVGPEGRLLDTVMQTDHDQLQEQLIRK